MNGFGDNPYDDGLDFVGCPPQKTELKLPEFPKNFLGDCKLICWAWHMSLPDGERRMLVKISDFKKDVVCGVYTGEVHFIDAITHEEWYRGKLKFYYTRNYIRQSLNACGHLLNHIAFRFVVKGDIMRVSDKMPEWECFILCTKPGKKVKRFEEIFVYGGMDIVYDIEVERYSYFTLNLGHNDGWYTHHPECSKRPIDWHSHEGDYHGHYCQRGWLFVCPGKYFRFNPSIRPPTGRFVEEALRAVGKPCFTEEAIRYGAFDLKYIRYIHHYQELEAITECRNSVESADLCMGLVYSNRRVPWITFFSMGYWYNPYARKDRIVLHLVEGNTKIKGKNLVSQFGEEQYCYGFGTQHYLSEHKLVDMASNQNTIGAPDETKLLMYFYNPGNIRILNPVERPPKLEPRLYRTLLKDELKAAKGRDEDCPFLEDKQQKQKGK